MQKVAVTILFVYYLDVEERQIADTRMKIKQLGEPQDLKGKEKSFWEILCQPVEVEAGAEQAEDELIPIKQVEEVDDGTGEDEDGTDEEEEIETGAEQVDKIISGIQVEEAENGTDEDEEILYQQVEDGMDQGKDDSTRKGVLYPRKENPSKQEKLSDELRNLRNSVLVGLLLINIIWLILMTTLVLPQLRAYFVNSHLTQLLFLSVYLIVLILQFVAMLVHRLITLSHYIQRNQQEQQTKPVTHALLETSQWSEC